MKITMDTNVGIDLKSALEAAGKTAARFVVTGFGCNGPLFDIELSDKKDGDVSFEENGIIFVVEEKLLIAIRKPVILKSGEGFTIKRTSCGC